MRPSASDLVTGLGPGSTSAIAVHRHGEVLGYETQPRRHLCLPLNPSPTPKANMKYQAPFRSDGSPLLVGCTAPWWRSNLIEYSRWRDARVGC